MWRKGNTVIVNILEALKLWPAFVRISLSRSITSAMFRWCKVQRVNNCATPSGNLVGHMVGWGLCVLSFLTKDIWYSATQTSLNVVRSLGSAERSLSSTNTTKAPNWHASTVNTSWSCSCEMLEIHFIILYYTAHTQCPHLALNMKKTVWTDHFELNIYEHYQRCYWSLTGILHLQNDHFVYQLFTATYLEFVKTLCLPSRGTENLKKVHI